jgi:hypothetical protein
MLVLKTVRAKPMVTHTEMIVHLYISELNKISTVCEKLFNSSIRKQNPVKFDFAILQALVKTRNKGKNKCTVKQFFSSFEPYKRAACISLERRGTSTRSRKIEVAKTGNREMTRTKESKTDPVLHAYTTLTNTPQGRAVCQGPVCDCPKQNRTVKIN